MSLRSRTDPVQALALGASEAVAIALFVDAIVNVTSPSHFDFPPVASLVAMIVAISLLAMVLGGRPRRAAPVLVAVLLTALGALVTSGALVSLSTRRGNIVELLTAGWSQSTMVATIVGANLVGLAIWLRAISLVVIRDTSRRALGSAMGITGAFVIVLLISAGDHSSSLTSAVRHTLWWFALCGALSVFSYTRARHLELANRAFQLAGQTDFAHWLLTMIVPVFATAMVAIGVTSALGRERIHFSSGQSPARTASSTTTTLVAGKNLSSRRPAAAASSVHASFVLDLRWLTLVLAGIGIVLVIGFLFFGIRLAGGRGTSTDSSESVGPQRHRYDWRTFLHALRAAFAGLFARDRDEVMPVESRLSGDSSVEPSSVRAHFRHLLLAARGAGIARRPAETPREFELRVRTALSDAPNPVGEVTPQYEAIRYGGKPDPWVSPHVVSEDVRRLTVALESSGSSIVAPAAHAGTGQVTAPRRTWASLSGEVDSDTQRSLLEQADARRHRHRMRQLRLAAWVGVLAAIAVIASRLAG